MRSLGSGPRRADEADVRPRDQQDDRAGPKGAPLTRTPIADASDPRSRFTENGRGRERRPGVFLATARGTMGPARRPPFADCREGLVQVSGVATRRARCPRGGNQADMRGFMWPAVHVGPGRRVWVGNDGADILI